MSLMLFKYVLPVMIGYVLYVGVSGLIWPFRKPSELAHRPSWLLGLWAGTAVALTLMLVLNMAYHLPSREVSQLAVPTLWLLAALILPGLAVYLWYRNRVADELLAEHRRTHAVPHIQAELKYYRETRNTGRNNINPLDNTWTDQLDAAENIVIDDAAEMPRPVAPDTEACNDSVAAEYDSAFDQAFNAAKVVESDRNSAAVEYNSAFDRAFNTATAATAGKEQYDVNGQQLNQDLQTARINELLETQLHAREAEVRSDMQAAAEAQLQFKTDEYERTQTDLRQIADHESQLRSETEAHLRITRKAMVQLESRTHKLESTRADELIELEQQLDERIRDSAKSDAAAAREQQRRIDLEEDLMKSRQELLHARTEIRKNTAARAKALASANKAVAFARQAVDSRAQTESELSSLKNRLLTQQTTVTSLIKALETEKSKHRDEMAYLNAQLTQKEGELFAEQNGDYRHGDAANLPLTARLVKKVARARIVS